MYLKGIGSAATFSPRLDAASTENGSFEPWLFSRALDGVSTATHPSDMLILSAICLTKRDLLAGRTTRQRLSVTSVTSDVELDHGENLSDGSRTEVSLLNLFEHFDYKYHNPS